jgi:putative molybdopterin biosynthesis protein
VSSVSNRDIYLTNIPVEEALRRFKALLSADMIADSEVINAADSLDRVTGEAVYAVCNSPPRDSAAMDGAAVVSSRTQGAGEASPIILKQGADYIQVDTGDPVSPPFDAVIMAEDIQEIERGSILIRAAATPWQHVRPVGEDIVKGEMILPGGHVIRPYDIGALLSGGITRIAVKRQPTVGIIPTGTEMIKPGGEMKEDGIIESNSYMLAALVRRGGGIPRIYDITPDIYEALKETISSAAARHDMVLVCAGTSAGREDYTARALGELGAFAVHGVAMKPGKPVILAAINGKPVIGVPGYPVSAYLAYDIFAAPALASLSGLGIASAPMARATLTRRLVSSLKHREYVRVKLGRVGEGLVASPLARGAGAAMSLVRADGFLVIGQDSEGVEAGTDADVILCRDLTELNNTVVCIGSHDLILDVLADMLPAFSRGVRLSGAHVGSMGGLLALMRGEAHIAPTHLLDEESGEYNAPIIKRLFAGKPMALIKGVGRTQGIMVQKGNPLGISGVHSLAQCRYINRQRGAGTRALLDHMLKREGVDPETICGYGREAATHMAVAAAVKNGSADAGMGVLSAARAMDLDFIPVGSEEYDFAVPAGFLELSHIRAFIDALKSGAFREKLKKLEGYSTDRCGEVIIIEH